MHTRKFNSLMPFNNEEWAAAVLNMTHNPPQSGPDLSDEHKIVEVKFKVRYPGRYNHLSWRALDYQKDYGRNREAYWGLGFYWLDQKATSIRAETRQGQERHVLARELYIVEWSWMDQFREYDERGESNGKLWKNRLIFPKFRNMPKSTHEIKVKGGRVIFTEGVDPRRFSIRTTK